MYKSFIGNEYQNRTKKYAYMDDSTQLQRKSNEKFKIKAHKIEHVIPIVPLYFLFLFNQIKIEKNKFAWLA